MYRFALLVLLATTAVGCDSGDVEPPESPSAALVGTWGRVATEQQVELTSPVTTTVLLRVLPAPATVTLSDDAIPELVFARSPDGRDDEIEFLSYDPRQATPERWATLTVSETPQSFFASLRVREPSRITTYFESGSGAVLSLTDSTVTLARVTLSGNAGVVAAQGAATFPQRTLTAGVPLAVATSVEAAEPGPLGVPGLRYTFDADGGFRSERDVSASASVVELGRWSVQGDRLLVEMDADGGSAELSRYDVRLAGGTLALSRAESVCSDAACLEEQAQVYGLDEGLAAYRELSVDRFERTDAPFKTTP